MDLQAIIVDACVLTEDDECQARAQTGSRPGRATGQPIWYGSRGLLARALGRTMMIWADSAAGDEESTDCRATEIWSIGTLPLAGQRRESMGRPGFRLGSLQILEAGCERRRRGKPRDWWTCCPTSFGSVNIYGDGSQFSFFGI